VTLSTGRFIFLNSHFVSFRCQNSIRFVVDVNAAIVVVLSESGTTARYVAKFRSGKVVVALTPSATVARQMAGVLKGVHAYIVDKLEDDVGLSKEVGVEAVKAGIAQVGDLMVVVSGTTYGHGANNQIRVEKIQGTPASRKPLMHLRSFEYYANKEK